jgi:hypothetical protein
MRLHDADPRALEADVTTPEDPFANPGGQPDPNQPPAYGQPPAAGQPPAYQGSTYGEQPVYGQPPASAQSAGAWQGPPLALWHTRAGGLLIDGLISFAVQLVLGLVNHGLGQLAGLAVFLYFGYLTGTTGQTPGRKVVGVKILREADGQTLGAGAGIGRSFLHILDVLSLGLGYLWPLWDPKRQTFADKICSTVVLPH